MTRASAAVDRALDVRHREASADVERILAATVALLARSGEATVNAIIAEAGSSKKGFYRYFSSKDELMLAVLERGVSIIVSYLEHQMAKESEARGQVARWIEGALAQVADPHLMAMSRAVQDQLTDRMHSGDVMAPMRDLLVAPVTAMGSDDPDRDVAAVFHMTATAMSRYVGSGVQPEAADVAHLVRFCLGGVGQR